MSIDTTTVQPHSTPSPSIPPRRPVTRWIVGGAGVALVGLVLGLSGVGPSRGSSSAHRPSVTVVTDDPGTGTGTDPVAVGTVTSPTETDVDQPAVVDQTGDTPEVEQPVPVPVPVPDSGVVVDQTGDTPEVEEPQPPVEALPATLSVSPDPIHLKTGVYSGSITVANVGDEAMHWAALTKPWVSLSDTTGDLGAHGENVIAFTIDESQLDAGAFTFKIKVWGNGGTEYVDVSGATPLNKTI